MNRVISAELYKIRHCKPLWFLPLLFYGAGLLYSSYHHNIYNLYNGLELFALPSLAYQYLSVSSAMLTGYIIGMDFSFRTIQNTLSVGVSRRSYYFSRMGVVMLLTAILYMVSMLGFVCGRLSLLQPLFRDFFQISGTLAGNRPEMELFWVKLAVCSAVVILQMWAYVSILNAACYFIKKQLPSMVAGLVLIIMELILRQVSNQYDLAFLRYLFDFTPVRVLQHIFDLYVIRDGLLTFGFLKFILSALVIMIASSAVGFCRFRYDTGNS